MTIKEMKEIIENVDKEHGWKLDHTDGYSSRRFWFRNFDHATVIAEKEEYWRPPILRTDDSEGAHWMSVVHYYFFREGDSTDKKPLSYYRQTKTSVLNRLKEVRGK